MRKPLVVREFDMIMSNPDYQDKFAFLPEKQFAELDAFLKGFAGNEEHADALEICKVGYRRNIGNTVSVCNYVGTIQTQSGQQIEILPKISMSEEDIDGARTKRVFLKMLRSVKDLSGKVLADAKLQTERMNLYEIFINMYLQEVDGIVKRGLKADYIRFEDNLNKYKGKLIVKEHIKRNMAHKERFYVAFDEFHVNRPENRLIKATLEKLMGVSKSSFNQKKIRELMLAFELVKPSVNHMALLSKVTIDRGNQHYENALMWSKVFLMNKSFFTYSGESDTRSILFPMERVFESYVAKSLKNAMADTGWTVKAQAKGKFLFDDPHIFALRPDLLVTRTDGTKIVLDTKWKRLTPDSGKNYGISQSDMYQMYAYAHRFASPEVWLLYPLNDEMRGKEEGIEFFSKEPDTVRVRVFFVDLENMDESMAKLKSLLMKKEDITSIKTPEFVSGFIKNQSWVFAKTYAEKAPHEYVVRGKQNGSDKDFMAVVDYIAKHGVTMFFWNHPNKYIFVDGWQYWVMKDSDDDPTMVLNRCDLSQYKLSIEWMGKQKG